MVFSVFFSRFFRFFKFFSVFSICFEIVCFGVSVVSLLYRNREFRLIWKKQKTHPNSLKESILGIFQKILSCFGLLRNSSVCFGCFDIGSKHRNKPKLFVLCKPIGAKLWPSTSSWPTISSLSLVNTTWRTACLLQDFMKCAGTIPTFFTWYQYYADSE